MKRLTTWIDDDEPFAIMRQNDLNIGHKTCINKLAAYEDTGLEPEEIKSNEQIIADLTKAVCAKDKKIKKLKELLKKAVDDIKSLADGVREAHGDDSVCGFCQYDCDTTVGECGEPYEECPGFDSDICFEWRYIDEIEEILNENRAIQR